jgi:hypothetical protein
MSSRMNRWLWSGLGVVVVWACAAAMGIWSPDLVTGSAHEHIPLIAITVWVWALFATGLIVMAPALARGDDLRTWVIYAGLVSVVWVAAAVISIAVPPMVTGSDPTTIPIAGIFSPIVAMAATAYATVAVVAIEAREETMGTTIDEVVRRVSALPTRVP